MSTKVLKQQLIIIAEGEVLAGFLGFWGYNCFRFVSSHVLTYIHTYIQGGSEKTAQTLMRYNFSTACHRVMRFPAKCSETNW